MVIYNISFQKAAEEKPNTDPTKPKFVSIFKKDEGMIVIF